jgi:hypothetical protein
VSKKREQKKGAKKGSKKKGSKMRSNYSAQARGLNGSNDDVREFAPHLLHREFAVCGSPKRVCGSS